MSSKEWRRFVWALRRYHPMVRLARKVVVWLAKKLEATNVD